MRLLKTAEFQDFAVAARDPATYFAALSPNAWTAPADGAFDLFASDWASRYDNNRGRLALRLSRIWRRVT